MNDYTEAPATKMLATHCVTCGRPLVDAVSCELGQGPECRKDIYPDGIGEAERGAANKLVNAAALAAQSGHAQKVLDLAVEIRNLGFEILAGKVERRFNQNRQVDIEVSEIGSRLVVKTPYRRKDNDAFLTAWRAIPGRYFDRTRCANIVPVKQKAALWRLLQEFFGGKWGKGPKGLFRVPTNGGH